MKLSELNEWLTLTANVGVLAGIIFLGIEIQQNTNVIRASSYNDNINSFNAWRSTVISDPESLRLMAEFRGIDDIDSFKTRLLINSQWSVYEQAFYSYSYGLMEENEWSRFSTAVCVNYNRATRQNMTVAQLSLTNDFQEYILANCG